MQIFNVLQIIFAVSVPFLYSKKSKLNSLVILNWLLRDAINVADSSHEL